MSTKLRPIAMINDTIRAGGYARTLLEDTARVLHISYPPRGVMPEADRLVEIFHSLPLRELSGRHFLWLFREPRSLSSGRSRYIQLCQYYGVGPYIKKKKLTIPNLDLNAVMVQQLRVQAEQRRARDQQAVQRQAAQQIWGQTVTGALGQQPAASFFAQQPQATASTWSFDWETTPVFSPEREEP